jgi:hypothetical protein
MTGKVNPSPRPVIAVGTGRCGTQFLKELFEEEPGVRAVHESDPVGEAFHRYCLWNQLPVDDGAFLHHKQCEIESASSDGKVFFESSAYLSLSITELHSAFAPRFILITRDPVDTVNSLWAKGWYEIAYRKQDPRAPVGYHAVGAPHHFFSRLVPHGEDFSAWQRLGRIGKLGWYWSTLHRQILTQCDALADSERRIVRLEELDHPAYLGLAAFAAIRPSLSAERFRQIAQRRPGTLPNRRLLASWSEKDVEEFSAQTRDVAGELGYDSDCGTRWQLARCAQLDAVAGVVA